MSSREKNEKRFNSDYESIFGKPKNAEDVVNGKALSLPAPYYPAEFRARRIAGVVVIGIEIDTDGNVAKTRVICGHPALGKTSEAAARKAKFKPTRVKGVATAVSGQIVYKFQP